MFGHLTGASKIVDAFKATVFLTKSTQKGSFLCACNLYRKFMKKFFKIALSLNDYLQKDNELDWQKPTTEAPDVFNTLRYKLLEPSVLALPHRHRLDTVNSKAFAYELGAFLLQNNDNCPLNELTAIGYRSRTLNQAEQNYSDTERGSLAVERAIPSLGLYIVGMSLKVRSDHNPLK